MIVELKGRTKIVKRTNFTKAALLTTLAAGLSIVIAGWQAQRVAAIQTSEDFPSDFGFIDLAAGQTARLNVVNLRRQPPPEGDTPPPEPDQPPPDPDSPPPDPDSPPPDPERVRLSFDIYIQPPPEPDAPACITRYRFLRRESCDVVLRRGEAASFDFTAAQDMKVAASIRSLGGPDTREGNTRLTPEPHLTPILEVREGPRTLFVVPGAIKGFGPQTNLPGTP